jgi:cephalosporin hydroxylase
MKKKNKDNFALFVNKNINKIKNNKQFNQQSKEWSIAASKIKYHYNFTWLGLPIIKFPNDILVMQEVIWRVKPDIIIETGIARGGSLIFFASLLKLINKKGLVVGIDIDIKKNNQIAIRKHPLYKHIKLLKGSSTSKKIVEKLNKYLFKKKVLVVLDSMHTENHVLQELEIYSKIVTKNSYLIVQDTFVEFFPKNHFKNRPWDKGNNPLTAIKKFLKSNKNYSIDENISAKAGITENPMGYLIKK